MLRAAKLSYGILIIIGFILTLVALFTPSWRWFTGSGSPDFGLVTYQCGSGYRQVANNDCHDWARHLETFEKVTLAFVIIAAIIEFFCVISFLLIFAKARYVLAAPAAFLCFVAAIFLLAAILTYGIRFSTKTIYMQSAQFEMVHNSVLGYSWYICIIAFFFVLAASMAAGATRSFAIVDTVERT